MNLSEQEVEKVINRVSSGESLLDIAEEFGVTYIDLWKTCYGKTGKRIRGDHTQPVVSLIESGYSTPYIANKLGISTAAVSKIYKRATNRSISQFRKTKSVRYGAKDNNVN